MIRECVSSAAWFSSMGLNMANPSGVRALVSGVDFCKRDACEVGGRMALLW